MRKFVYLFFVVCSLPLFSQTVNYALDANGNTTVETSNLISELNSATEFTFQTWMSTSQWNTGAKLLSINKDNSSNLSIELGVSGSINVTITNQTSSTASIQGIATDGTWQHISLVYDGSASTKLKAYINNSEVAVSNSASLPSSISLLNAKAQVASGFSGKLDETRLFSKAVDATNLKFQNTLNHYHPNWSDLVFYYKYDQEQCPDVYDYKQQHHSIFVNGNKVPVTDNANFKYRMISGYTSFARFFDRSNTNAEMYKMTNDLLFLSCRAMNNGTAFMDGPDNSGILTNTTYLPSFSGRNGVLQFNGEGSQMDIGLFAAIYDSKTEVSGLTFQGWIYIDEWVEGAYLFKKEESTTSRINIRLGDEATKVLSIECGENVWGVANKLSVGKWHYIAVRYNPTALAARTKFNFHIDGIYSTPTLYPSSASPSIPLMLETRAYMGVNFKGKMDEVVLYRTNRTDAQVTAAKDGTPIPMPSIGGNIGAQALFDTNAYWTFDNADEPGFDSYSYRSFCEIIREAYKGKRGYKFKLGLIAESGWEDVIGNADYRAGVVADIAKILPYFDGVDMDFEWCYTNTTCWNNYSTLMKQVKAICDVDGKDFTITPHPVSYQLPKADLDIPHAYLFQNYGPSPSRFTWSDYVSSAANFVNWGYTREKILMGIPTLAALTGSSTTGYINIVNANPNLQPSDNTAMYNGNEWTFNGVDLVKQKTQYVIDQGFGGIMFFDLGNDMPTTDSRSLVRAINDVISANVDTLITSSITTNINNITTEKNQNLFEVYPNPAIDYVKIVLSNMDNYSSNYSIYNISGKAIERGLIKSKETTLSVGDLSNGIYLIEVSSNNSKSIKKLTINRKL